MDTSIVVKMQASDLLLEFSDCAVLSAQSDDEAFKPHLSGESPRNYRSA